MFHEASIENLFFTEHWPASTYIIKGNFSKKIKSLSSLSTSQADSLSNSRSIFLSNLCNSYTVIEAMNKLNLFNSQESLLDIIEEE